MIRSQIELLLSYQINGPAHLCFNIQAMRLGRQFVREESLLVTQGDGLVPPLLREFPGTHGSRFLRFDAQPGPLSLTYRATVEQLPLLPLPDLAETTIGWLPDEMLRYLLPSRYVESDRLAASAQQLFGHLPPGLARVQQITAWIHDNISYLPGASSSETAASQVFEQRSGVCRDFAHLGIAFCRALNIPARLVVGYVWFEEPPQDFHAIFEAWLGGQWVMFDPTGMAPTERLVRVGTGVDAKDVAFATFFGPVGFVNKQVSVVEQVDDAPPTGAQPDQGTLVQDAG